LAWRIELADEARKVLAEFDKPVARDDRRAIGEALKGTQPGQLWKYRVGDYHIITSIEDGRLCVLVVRVGHRREVYRG